ncbi:nucleotidyltransferase family protein [Actinotalea fermentans]|uniref:Nucleotidyltransferase n=1 Tax=Actinotalea fermentans TaxID=43671 RepID=A0A511YWZ3_9CELL|nr:nucleotidyltransferase family protein [Actinotalea fermentans]GEN79708.1 hypothetical protein AFE02nite_14420 [Actinotalea fermentans]
MTQEHPVVAALVAAVGGPPPADPAALARVPTAEAVEVAEAHRLGSALLRHLTDGGVASDLDPLVAALREERTAQVVAHLTTLADLRALGGLLDGADVPWVVVKGPAAAASFWPAADMRDYRDLDVVVDPGRFADVVDLLAGAGAEQLDLNWGLIRRQMRAELTFVLPRGTLLDLHWHPVNEAPVRRRFDWPVAGLLARRVPVSLGSVTVPTLDPVDAALHMAYHAVVSGGYRLLWLADVAYATAAVARAGRLEELVRRAQEARLDVVVRVALDRVERVLGSAPAPAWTRRRGALWRAAVRARDGRLGGGGAVARGHLARGTGRLLVGSTRGSTAASAWTLGAGAADHAWRALARIADPEENPLHTPDGDVAAREAYLAAVSRNGLNG